MPNNNAFPGNADDYVRSRAEDSELFLEVQENTGIINYDIPPVSLGDFLTNHEAVPELMEEVTEFYVGAMNEHDDFVYTAAHAQALLDNVLVHHNAEPRGGYVFEMPIEREGEDTQVVQFYVPQEAVARYN